MKKSGLLLLFIFNIEVSKSQNYVPLPDSSCVWSVGNEKWFIDGDTLINSITYRRVFETTNEIYNYTPGLLGSIKRYYRGAIRNSESEKRVYGIRIPTQSTEKVIYDFSKSVGDTLIIFSMEQGTNFKLVLIKIDSTIVEGQIRRRLNFSSIASWPKAEAWIEGIGSSFGLFGSGLSADETLDGGNPPLLCQHINGQMVFKQEGYNTCLLSPSNLDKLTNYSSSPTVYPQPSNNDLFIEISLKESEMGTYSLLIINKIGQIVRDAEITIHGQDIKVDISELPESVYTVQFKNSNGETVYKRFVIAR